MRLKKFSEYVDALLPHEVLLLERSERFQDSDRSRIFKVVKHNVLHCDKPKSYDVEIDKRKYSHLMNWMQLRLGEYCTDNYYKRLNYFDNQIRTDTISSEEETELLKHIKNYDPHHFHFIRFYEVVKNYLNFLLVRVRLNDYELINRFVHNYHDDYIRCKDISNRMTQATSDIVADYHRTKLTENALKWAPWLKRLFRSDDLDGYNRYQALILFSYLALLEKELLEETIACYDELEEELVNGRYYSRKLLLNFYGNRQLILMRLHKYDLALYYGQLSISEQGHDYIMYLNNYCFNLLKLGRPQQALRLLKEALPFARQMSNKYNKSLFISSLMKCYNDNGEYKNAKRYAENQLELNEKDILEHNWNRFFRTYLETLLHLGDYKQAKRTLNRYNLLEKESGVLKTYVSFPYFKWFMALIEFKEGNISGNRFKNLIQREQERLAITHNANPSESVMNLINEALAEVD
ncbi:tetratricopeptide repeat protein [Arenibacter amylolyticus]|uniref:tetratricopeptide repeat protein n=1 Tax=Arenibacter amylolyticus TaxID=1406873 RepID=UPI000A39CC7E|nr:tetratricopeptide repeat protein [Arenibacter amylolyticus]